MIPPILQQVLLLIESLLRAIEAEYCPPLRVFGIPLFRLPGARTRAAAQLRRLADEIAAVARTLPTSPSLLPAPQANITPAPAYSAPAYSAPVPPSSDARRSHVTPDVRHAASSPPPRPTARKSRFLSLLQTRPFRYETTTI